MAEVKRLTQLLDRSIFKPWGDFAAKHTTLSRIINPRTIGVTGLIGALTNYASNFFVLDPENALVTVALASAGVLAKYVSNRIDNAVLRDDNAALSKENAETSAEADKMTQNNSTLKEQMEKMQRTMINLRGMVTNITHLTVHQKVIDTDTKESIIKPVEQDYVLLEQMGEGGFAIVRRATNLTLDRTEVMKIVHIQYASDPNFIGRFADESNMLMRLDHPNIVKIYGHGVIEVQISPKIKKVVPFYTMEPLSGSSLASILQSMRLELSEKTVELMLRLAQTVKYFHQMGIIHRDIKPGNIFIVDTPELVKIIDFGVAKDTEEERARTRTGEMAGGTQEYMPREQFLAQPLDIRADLYSLGATFFEMLTGTPPYPTALIPNENRFEKYFEYFARLTQKDWSEATFSKKKLAEHIADLPKQNIQYIFQSLFKNPQQEQMLLKVNNQQLEGILEEMVTKHFIQHEQHVFLLDGIRRMQYSKIPKIELHLMKGGATPHYSEMLEHLQDIFNKLLHPDRDWRYASDDELINDLEFLRDMLRNFDATVAPSRG